MTANDQSFLRQLLSERVVCDEAAAAAAAATAATRRSDFIRLAFEENIERINPSGIP